MSSDRFRAEPESGPRNDGVVPNPTSDNDTAVEPTVTGRVEKTMLRAEVEALKRELERREQRHGQVIEQYEQLLQTRTDGADRTDERARDRNDGTLRERLTRVLPAGID